jgi:hypothetical protein
MENGRRELSGATVNPGSLFNRCSITVPITIA